MFGKKKGKELDAQIEKLQREQAGNQEAGAHAESFASQFDAMMAKDINPNTEEGRKSISEAAANFDNIAAGLGIDSKMTGLTTGAIKYDSPNKEANKLYEKAGLTNNMAERFNLCFEADALGHILATYTLAQCYEKGTGTLINIPESIRLYEKAANQKVTNASKRLFEIYQAGIIVKQDSDKANYWKSVYEKDAYTTKDFKSSIQSLFKK